MKECNKRMLLKLEFLIGHIIFGALHEMCGILE